MNPLKVCLLVDTLRHNAGTEQLVARLAAGFDRRSVEPHVCCFEPSERLSQLPDSIPTAVFPLTRVYGPEGMRRMWEFRRYTERNRIDLVHSFMVRSDIFGVVSLLGSRRAAVVTSRLNTGYWYTPSLLRAYRFLNRHTDRIVTNSRFARDKAISMEKLAPGKLEVLYQGVDLDRYASRPVDPFVPSALGIPPDAKVVGVVANYRQVKDLPLFLRAARIVASADPAAVFLLVGSGEMRASLEILACELGIKDKVFLTNGVGDVPGHLSRMCVACLTSESEGFPNALLEYMAARLPIVATDVGGVSEAVTHGINGFLVRERSPEAFAEPLVRLLRDDALRATMGAAGLERARSEFDLDLSVRNMARFYREAVSAISPRRS